MKKSPLFIAASLIWWFILLPFDYAVIGSPIRLVREFIFHFLQYFDPNLVFETDSLGMYLLVPTAIILGGISTPVLQVIIRKSTISAITLLHWLLVGIVSFFLFKYGWDKVTKQQFYLPEPNTVYTPFGHLSKDIAFWSLLGSSYSLVVLIGIIEIIAGICLLNKRTRFLGSLLSIGIFASIFIINCCFDISVKLFSFDLLLFSIGISCYYPEKWALLLTSKHKQPAFEIPRFRLISSIVVVLIMTIEVLAPTFRSGNWNDDYAVRPSHSGAYRVSNNQIFQRFYIHRNLYLIVELNNGKMIDIPIKHTENENLSFHMNNQLVTISWKNQVLEWNERQYAFHQLPYDRLPILQSGFHFFSDNFH
jgi:hypothetical protein